MSTEFDASDHQSDSDLSEVQEAVVVEPSPSPTPVVYDTVHINHDDDDAVGSPDVAVASEDNASDDNASDDADYDMDDSVSSPVDGAADVPEDDGSSSQESRRAAKRKLGDDEDDYIQRNPELYGLRRSVS